MELPQEARKVPPELLVAVVLPLELVAPLEPHTLELLVLVVRLVLLVLRSLVAELPEPVEPLALQVLERLEPELQVLRPVERNLVAVGLLECRTDL